MVRALLDGRKTQTRRVVKTGSPDDWNACPYGVIGDLLWVRETWGESGYNRIEYRAAPADGSDFRCVSRWRPSIHMPRFASRITLRITDVRVQRVQEISEEDARAEGIVDGGCLTCGEPEPCGCADPRPDARDAFAYIWHQIHGETGGRAWHANPWVWVLRFDVIRAEALEPRP